jgi:hypothetical protein
MASASRDLQLSSAPDAGFVEAQKQWQGGNGGILIAMREMKGDVDSYLHAALILKRLEMAPDLPVGAVLWHASKTSVEPPTDVPLATSVTFEGAEAHAQRHIQEDKRVYHKLVVAGLGVKALAIGADEYYEDEQEMLLMMDVDLEEDRRECVDGKLVITHNVTLP